VELDRFQNKKIYMTNTNEAINTPIQALKNTIEKSKIISSTSESFSFSKEFSATNTGKLGFMKHFLNGVSHMIPFVVFSGILFAIVHAIAIAVHDNN
jgi:PTS system fructose-specific IIC component